jgi:hypothetical protein
MSHPKRTRDSGPLQAPMAAPGAGEAERSAIARAPLPPPRLPLQMLSWSRQIARRHGLVQKLPNFGYEVAVESLPR